MIRHKYESTTTGNGATITVSTPTGFSNDVTTMDPPRMGVTAGAANSYAYVIADADGTNWEYGYGRVDGTTFYRDVVIQSTNAGSRLTLTAGTHTVFVPDGGLSNRIATMHLTATNASITTETTETFSFNVTANGTSVDQFPGYTAPTLPSTAIDFSAVLPYARGFRVHAYVSGYSTVAGYAICKLTADGNYYGELPGVPTFHLDTAEIQGVNWTSPLLEQGSPYAVTSPDGWFPGTIGLDALNHSTGTADMDAGLMVEWYL